MMKLSTITSRVKNNPLAKRFSSFSKRTKIIVSVIFFLLIALFLHQLFLSPAKNRYITQAVEKNDLINTITENGNVTANSEASITSPATGVIEELYVHNGDQVNAGDPLFKVHSTASDQEKAQAYADLVNAQNDVASAGQSQQALQAQLEQARQTVLSAQDAVNIMNNNISNSANNPSTKQPYTQVEIDAINSNLTSAKESFTATETKYNQSGSAITAAQSSLTAASDGYQATQDSVVTSPIAGTVANLAYSIGNQVSGSSGNTSSSSNANNNASNTTSNGSNNTTSSSSTTSVGSGSTVLLVGDFSNMSVQAQVNEVDIPKITTGDKAIMTFDALGTKSYVGTVTNVDTVGTQSSGVVTYGVTIAFAYPPSDIKPGMSTTVSIQTARKDNVLSVPSSSVQTSPNGSFVRVLKANGQIQQVTVTTGMQTDTDTEITSGLQEGENVVVAVIPTGNTSSSGASPFSGSGFGGTRGFGGGGGAFIRTGGGGGGRAGAGG